MGLHRLWNLHDHLSTAGDAAADQAEIPPIKKLLPKLDSKRPPIRGGFCHASRVIVH
jgi:hypothetical protein